MNITQATDVEVNIRGIKPEDYAAIYRVAETTWLHTFKEIHTPEQTQAGLKASYTTEAIEAALNEGQDFIVLTESRHIVAFAAYTKTDKYLNMLTQDTAFSPSLRINKLYCMPECQKKGYGSMLLSWIEDYAQEEKLASIHVLVNRQNKATQFYLDKGYIQLGELNETYDGFLREDYLMLKTIQ